MASNTDDPYFGYTSTGNKQLTELRLAQRHLGDDLMHYPEADTSRLPQYEPTINWADPKYSSDNGSDIKSDYVRQASADSIEVINKRFASQTPEEVEKLQDQWFKVSMVIENLRDSIINEAQALAKTWKGDAAAAFLMRGPGAAAKSLDDWYNCAITNSLGLMYLASTMRDHKAQMDYLYQQYKADMVSFSNGWPYNIHHSRSDYYKYTYEGSGDPKKDHPNDYLNDLRDHAEQWSVKARAIQYSMARSYWDVINQHLNGGSSTIFEGPTDAIMADPTLLMNIPKVPNVPTAPNVPAVPNVPTVPTMPQPPQVPTVPTVPDVPGTPTVPGAPDLTVPSAPNLVAHALPDPAVSVPHIEAPQFDPTLALGATMIPTGLQLDGMPSTGTSNPNLTGLGRGLGIPPTAGKLAKGVLGKTAPPEGEGVGQGRGQMPPNTLRNKAATPPEQRPLVPGAEDEEFGRPGGLGSAPPVLRGRSGTPGGRRPAVPDDGAGNRSGAPLRPGSNPPVLNRRRQGGPGQQGGAPMGPNGPVDDETLHPGLPGTSRPVLRGTRLGQGGPPEERQPPARALRGARRPAGATEPEMASRRKNVDTNARRDEEHARDEREFEKIQHLLSNEAPWTVQTPGGTVLDNALERQAYQVEPKPTLRGGATG